jgi:hypothetical protein
LEFDSHAAARVRAEVSGFPLGRLGHRLMVFCQAAIDDSGNEPNQDVFVLAGFVASAVNWIQFTLEWDRALKEPPALDYFKFSEAMRLRGQFDKERGWTEPLRDERLRKLAGIVREHVPARFHAAMRHEHYAKYVRDIAPARVRTLLTDTPYILLAGRTVIAATTAVTWARVGDECAFYFDTQPGQDIILRAIWDSMVRAIEQTPVELPEGLITPRIVTPPKFESETQWLPLQAADMLAGATRMEIMRGSYPAALSAIQDIPGNPFNMEEALLKEMGEGLVQMMDEFQKANPGIPLFHYDKKSAKRLRKKVMRGLLPKKPGDA